MSYPVKDANGNPQTVTPPVLGPAPTTQSLSVAPATDSIAEPGGAPITGANMPAGGAGLTGWLSSIWKALTGTLSVSGSVSVSNLPSTQPVSGSVSVSNLPGTQPVSGSVSVSNLPATQPVSAATLPLPTGAATDAHLTNVQSAPGTAQTTALTVQGNPSGVAVPTALSASDAGIAAMVTAYLSSVLTPPIQMRAQSQVVTDLASTTLTASGTGSAIALDSGNTYGALINVTAASGTNPTLDLILQESFDGGATFKDIYMVLRIKATGVFYVPTMLLTGQRRWRWAISGTTPSFTLGITATRGTGTAQVIRNFYDYTQIAPNTLNSKSPTWDFTGCKSLQLTAFAGAGATTNAVFQIVISPDSTNWATAGSTVNPGPNSLATVNVAHLAQFATVNVATAGVAETLNYVNLYGVG